MASLQSVTRLVDIDPSKITFGEVKVINGGIGNKTIAIKYNGQGLMIQLPSLQCPYGLSKWPKDNERTPNQEQKIQLDLSFKGYDKDDSIVATALNKLSSIDEMVIQEAMEQSTAWFKKKNGNREYVDAVYTPIVKRFKDKDTGEITNKYPPTVRLNIPKKNGAIDLEVWNARRERLPFETVDFKGAQVTSIVHVASIWVIAGKCGVTLRAKQLKVTPRSTIKGYAFVDDDEEVESQKSGGKSTRSETEDEDDM
jgi:hypothetical protein